jgi:toxin secretion/phage lysis holin
MDQLVASAKVFAGVLGGMLAGWDPMLKALIGLIIIDYISGLLKVFIISGGILSAFREKRFQSEIGHKGITKKLMMLLLVATCHFVDHNIAKVWDAGGISLGSMAAGLYAVNEFASIIENVIASEVPVPGLLKRTLTKIREKFAE